MGANIPFWSWKCLEEQLPKGHLHSLQNPKTWLDRTLPPNSLLRITNNYTDGHIYQNQLPSAREGNIFKLEECLWLFFQAVRIS